MKIPPLQSGGVMLTYRCTNACKHCLYRCSPAHDPAFMPEERINRTFDALSRERSLHGMHIAGGEATIDWSRLLYAIRSAQQHGVSLDYLETNASWCSDYETARDGMEQLRDAGLDCVLISASLFHNEFTPLRCTKHAIRAACDVFGRRGAFIWTPDVLAMMERGLDPDRTHKLKESCKLLGLDPERGDVWRTHNYLRPGGRAAERLDAGLTRQPAESFRNDKCGQMLRGTQHFHIDPYGNLYTGGCPGIAVGTIDDFHPEITEETFPVFAALYQSGPYGLWQKLAPDFVPDADGYVSECHFCLEVRKHLVKTRPDEFTELRPREFYFVEK